MVRFEYALLGVGKGGRFGSGFDLFNEFIVIGHKFAPSSSVSSFFAGSSFAGSFAMSNCASTNKFATSSFGNSFGSRTSSFDLFNDFIRNLFNDFICKVFAIL